MKKILFAASVLLASCTGGKKGIEQRTFSTEDQITAFAGSKFGMPPTEVAALFDTLNPKIVLEYKGTDTMYVNFNIKLDGSYLLGRCIFADSGLYSVTMRSPKSQSLYEKPNIWTEMALEGLLGAIQARYGDPDVSNPIPENMSGATPGDFYTVASYQIGSKKILIGLSRPDNFGFGDDDHYMAEAIIKNESFYVESESEEPDKSSQSNLF